MHQKSIRQIWSLLGLAVFINAALSTLFMLSVTPNEIWLSNISTSFFLPASLIAHFSFLYFLISLILLLIYRFQLRGKPWIFITALLFALLLLTIIVDTRVFSLYRFHLNSMSLNLLLGGAAGNILSFSWSMWLSILSITLLILATEFFFIRWLFQQSRFSTGRYWLTILLMMISTQVFYGYRDAVADSSIIMQLRYIPWAQPLTMKRSLRKLGLIENISNKTTLKVRNNTAINYPVSALNCNTEKKLNYLVLMVDSMRFDMMNAEVTPNTYQFAQDSLVFNQHWSTSNSTRFGVFGFFYGMPSTYWFDMLKEQRGSVLFDVLIKQDYQLHLDASAPLSSPEFDRTIFSAVRDSLTWGSAGSNAETDTVVVERLLKFLDQQHDKNFFAFSFLDAAHGYNLPAGESAHFQPALEHVNYLELNNGYDPEPYLNLYKSTLYYNDRLLGHVYKKLSDRQLLENTVVIITSDHGQEFNDLKQNYWGHNSNFSEYQVRVPLIIRWPGKAPAQIDSTTSHEDIAASLLSEGFSCSNKISDYSTGFSLFDEGSLPEKRNLLLANWNNKAIFTGETYYNFTTYGNMEVLDRNYQRLDDQKIDSQLIQQQLLKMSQYLK